MFDVEFDDADRHGARTCATRANCPPDARSPARPRFFLGAADVPIDPPPDWRPTKLAAKIAAGAEFVQTQFCMDPESCAATPPGSPSTRRRDDLYLLIGIAPLRSAKSARWMRKHLYGTIIPDAFIERLERAADPAAEGRRICVELIEELASIPGVAGVHIMAPANEAAVPDVIAEAKRRVR